jgi:glycosyltransferase involved in cell wall biosynthesis
MGMIQLPNIHLIGPRIHKELPEYIVNIDVGIVPYLRDAYTMTVVPTKINEYLAMGKPVVSTDLPEVNAFNDEHNVLITSPNRAAEFLSSIERALEVRCDPVTVAHRRGVAALNDWDMRIERMCKVLEHEWQASSGVS